MQSLAWENAPASFQWLNVREEFGCLGDRHHCDCIDWKEALAHCDHQNKQTKKARTLDINEQSHVGQTLT